MNFRSLLISAAFLSLSASTFAGPLNVECLLRGSCINSQDVLNHLKEFQAIADANNGNRSAGSRGHEFSGNYVAQKLLAAGFKVELQPFFFMKFEKHAAALQIAGVNYQDEKDFNVMTYSGSGSVSAPLSAVDISMGAGNVSTSGCEADDFVQFPKGNIALIQRGTCNFAQKVLNAEAAGASGVILFNQGNSADREELFLGTLSESEHIGIPVQAISYPFAIELLKGDVGAVSIDVDAKTQKKASFNVIAETASGNDANVVMLGAHLDSVTEGPGINDNASGSAALLEIALELKDTAVTNKVRFAWFSAEELGLIGSTKYVEGLTASEKASISLYVNADMVSSPNYMLGVYDGDGSKFGQKGPKGSELIESMLHDFFASQGLKSVETELSGRSDYAAFSAAGIAVGGVFTGAEGKKSEEEAVLFGGKAGEAYDSCYHKACDNISNLSIDALEFNTHALAFMAVGLGQSSNNGIRDNDKVRSLNQVRQGVVFPKHYDCHGDVHAE